MFRIRGHGTYDHVMAQVDPTHRALRVSVRPSEVGLLGSYSDSRVSGVMAAGLAAAAVIYAWRNSAPAGGMLKIVRRVRLTASTDGTAFAQGSALFDLIRLSSFSAQYTGGSNQTLQGKSGARATRMAASQVQFNASAVGDIAVANTGALAAGTPAPVADSAPMKILVAGAGANPAILVVPPPGLLLDLPEPWQGLECMQNEGFAIRATVPATGTWKFGVDVDWDEADPARYFG